MIDPKKREEVTKPVLSVQVIHYVCSNCSEEKEEIALCPACKGPMRVVEVKEYFGAEAAKKIEELRGNGTSSTVTVVGGDGASDKVAIENGIVDEDDNLDALDEFDAPKDNKTGDRDLQEWKDLAEMAGDDIFEEEANELNLNDTKIVTNDDIVALLDSEEEEIGKDDYEELPDL